MLKIVLAAIVGAHLLTYALISSEFDGPFEIEIGSEEGRKSAKLYVPKHYTADRKWPVITLLHGYGSDGAKQSFYYRLKSFVSERGFFLIVPEGIKEEGSGKQFWNATDACCDFKKTNVDDVSYLTGLVHDTKRTYNIDLGRVYAIGHSNGGFMAHRLACEAADLYASIVSFAGAGYKNADLCDPSEPISVLQIHGTDDNKVKFDGDEKLNFPSALESVNQWVTRNNCATHQPNTGKKDLNIAAFIAGDDTSVESWSSCDANTTVALWTVDKGSHVPWLSGDFQKLVLDFMFASQKDT